MGVVRYYFHRKFKLAFNKITRHSSEIAGSCSNGKLMSRHNYNNNNNNIQALQNLFIVYEYTYVSIPM